MSKKIKYVIEDKTETGQGFVLYSVVSTSFGEAKNYVCSGTKKQCDDAKKTLEVFL